MEIVCEIESGDANSGVLKASVQPLPTRTYFCHFKSYPGQKKSEQTEVMHEILIIMNIHMSVQGKMYLVSDSKIKTSKKTTFSKCTFSSKVIILALWNMWPSV